LEFVEQEDLETIGGGLDPVIDNDPKWKPEKPTLASCPCQCSRKVERVIGGAAVADSIASPSPSRLLYSTLY